MSEQTQTPAQIEASEPITQKFALATLLSAIDGRLMTEFSEVHRLFDWVTGDQLFTHQLPRAATEVDPFFKEQFPDLAALEVPPFEAETIPEVRENIEKFLHGLVDSGVPATYEVPQMNPEDHTHVNPLAELAMNYPGVKVLPVIVEREDDR